MKLNRFLTASVLGLSFLTTSAFASDNGGDDGKQTHRSVFGWMYNQVTGRGGYNDDNQGKECDHGHGNDSSGCPASTGGGSTGSSGGSSSGGGSTSGGSTGSGGGVTVGPKG